MLKTLGTIFKLFSIERATTLDTEVREGFFMKNSECRVKIKKRVPNMGS
jgi:hypothetical protein